MPQVKQAPVFTPDSFPQSINVCVDRWFPRKVEPQDHHGFSTLHPVPIGVDQMSGGGIGHCTADAKHGSFTGVHFHTPTARSTDNSPKGILTSYSMFVTDVIWKAGSIFHTNFVALQIIVDNTLWPVFPFQISFTFLCRGLNVRF